MTEFKTISGSICAPLGFRAAAVFCDIKRLGTGKGSEKGKKRDLALIVSEAPAVVAGMFTSNQVCAAPVKVSARNAKRSSARAIVVNSGNANACTGRQGMRDAEAMTRMAAEALSKSGLTKRIPANEVLVGSTGRIGVPMPMQNVTRGIRACSMVLKRSSKNARDVAEAIMTSDTRRKEIAVEFKLGGKPVRIGGVCKGAGMIQPQLTQSLHATMLAFITTDASIESATLKNALKVACNESFNRVTVDGDMSTNDTVIVLANGLAGNRSVNGGSPYRGKFQKALTFVCLELAKMIVRDGEGISRVICLRVRGARNSAEAEAAARAVANSALVKTSWCGGDPNWGRILCAIGYSSARIDESKVDIGYSPSGSSRILFGCRRGQPTGVAIKRFAPITTAKEFDIHVDLHRGRGEFVIYASDLTEDYVSFNKGDITDPASLGG